MNALFVLVVAIGFSMPLWVPYAPSTEGRLLPVVENVEIRDEQLTSDGLSFNVWIDKQRDCEFVGIAWYKLNKQNEPRLVDVEFNRGGSPVSRLAGHQNAGTWTIPGIRTLDRTIAFVQHRCHPLWQTYTKFFERNASLTD